MTSLALALVFGSLVRAECPSLESEPISPFAIAIICQKLAHAYPDEMIGGSLQLQIVHCRNRGKFTRAGERYGFEVPILGGTLSGSARFRDSPLDAKTPEVDLDEPSLG